MRRWSSLLPGEWASALNPQEAAVSGRKYRTRNYFVYSLNHTFRSARYNATSTIASHNMSKSGGGHGGGFSGGSSFGGGGGGMRSR